MAMTTPNIEELIARLDARWLEGNALLEQEAIKALQSQAERIKELEEAEDDHQTELADAARGPWAEWSIAIMKSVRDRSGYDGFDDKDGVDLPAEVEDHFQEMDRLIEKLTEKLRNEKFEHSAIRAQLAALQVDDELPELPDFKFACKGGALFQPTEMRAYARQAQAMVRAKMVPLEKDAARYRWLRDSEWEMFRDSWLCECHIYGEGPDQLGAAIDAAMGITGEPK